jgi:hypothetical protein
MVAAQMNFIFMSGFVLCQSLDGIVGIVTSVWARQLRNCGMIYTRAKRFISSPSISMGSGAHLSSYAWVPDIMWPELEADHCPPVYLLKHNEIKRICF